MKIVAFDTETRGFDWFDPSERAFLASWADAGGEYCADLSTPEGIAQYLNAVNSADLLVCHNASFDVHQTRETLGWNALDCKPVRDTDIIARVVHPELKGMGAYGLENLGQLYFGLGKDKIEELANSIGVNLKGKNATPAAYWHIWRAYPEEMEAYARQDARLTYDLYARFAAEADENARRVMELENAVLPVLIRAETRGVRIDQEPVMRLKREYSTELNEVEEYLSSELGDNALGGKGSDDALVEALQKIGVPLYRRTDSGDALATNAGVLREFEDDFPQIEALFRMRRLRKFLKTYLEPMEGRDVVHTSFKQCEAWTGRTASMRPNMQNIPKRAGKEVRQMFIPRDGYCFLRSDYDSIEARLLAYYCGDPAYRELVDTRDPHAWMASVLFGGEVDYYLKGTPGEKRRDEAKNGTYAITYGAGGRRLTDMFGLDPGPYAKQDDMSNPKFPVKKGDPLYAEGKALARKVRSSIPGYTTLKRRIDRKVATEGHVNTIWGRKQVVNKDKTYLGLSGLIQGSAADIMKQGLVNVDAAITPLGGHVLLVVHDEILSEVPIEVAEECLRLQDAAMEAAYDLDPPLRVSGDIITTNYADG